MYLRAKGAAVYGFGGQKTPEPFVNACSRFLYLDKLATRASSTAVDIDTDEPAREDAAATPLRVPTAKLKQDRKLVELLRNARRRGQGRERLGARRRGSASRSATRRRSIRANYGYSTLTKLLKATELFQLEKEGTSEVAVRDARGTKAAKA